VPNECQVTRNCIPLDTRSEQCIYLRPLNTYAPVQPHAILCELSLVQNGTMSGISPCASVFPRSVSFHPCSILVFIRHLEDNNRKWSHETVSTHKRIKKVPLDKTLRTLTCSCQQRTCKYRVIHFNSQAVTRFSRRCSSLPNELKPGRLLPCTGVTWISPVPTETAPQFRPRPLPSHSSSDPTT